MQEHPKFWLSSNEDFGQFFNAPVLEPFEVKKLPTFFSQNWIFCQKSKTFVKFHQQISHFSPKYTGYEFYGCTTVFDEVMIFRKNEIFVIFLFLEKNYQEWTTFGNFFSKNNHSEKLFFQNIMTSSKTVVQP